MCLHCSCRIRNMSSSTCENIKSDIPNNSAANAPHTKLPASSREKYNRTYEYFMSWRNGVGINNFSENTFLSYFEHLAKTKQPSTLISSYSMLKATINAKNGINIDTYKKLTMFLKQNMKVYEPKTSKIFTKKDINTFLEKAPDEIYLCLKVVLILGVQGGCCRKLLNINMDDIERHSEQLLLVKMEDLKTKSDRSFVVRGLDKEILEKYLALRPPNLPTKRLLIHYANGRCFKKVLGRSKVSNMPSKIAEYLNLPNPELYTYHCFKKTACALSSYSERRIQKHSGVAAEISKVYVQVPKETEATKENEDILIANNIKEECSLDLSSPQLYTSETWDAIEKQHTSEKSSAKPSPPKEDVTQKIGSAKISITDDNNETRTISIPSENVTILFRNCQNVSDININF